MATAKKDFPIIAFPSAAKWRAWLAKHHATSDGIWMRLYKKGTETPSVTYDGALDEALCYGWIDGLKKSYDAESWLQKFTPRRAKSSWSTRNTEHVARLIAAGRMTPSGQREIDAAKQDGRWEQSYDSQKSMTVPEDFLAALKKHKGALRFFETLNRANVYAIAYRLQTAKKAETRERRLREIVEMLKRGGKFH